MTQSVAEEPALGNPGFAGVSPIVVHGSLLSRSEAGNRIVWPEEKHVEVYRQPGPTGHAERTLEAAPAVIECAAVAGVRVDLATPFA